MSIKHNNYAKQHITTNGIQCNIIVVFVNFTIVVMEEAYQCNIIVNLSISLEIRGSIVDC